MSGRRIALANGTRCVIGPDWVVTTLPDGRVVEAHPEARSAAMAAELGYGADIAKLTRDHDVLHALLCDLLGLPTSFALARAAGSTADAELATLEEVAVLAVQRFAQAAGWAA